jgi:hypothetical protein
MFLLLGGSFVYFLPTSTTNEPVRHELITVIVVVVDITVS